MTLEFPLIFSSEFSTNLYARILLARLIPISSFHRHSVSAFFPYFNEKSFHFHLHLERSVCVYEMKERRKITIELHSFLRILGYSNQKLIIKFPFCSLFTLCTLPLEWELDEGSDVKKKEYKIKKFIFSFSFFHFLLSFISCPHVLSYL